MKASICNKELKKEIFIVVLAIGRMYCWSLRGENSNRKFCLVSMDETYYPNLKYNGDKIYHYHFSIYCLAILLMVFGYRLFRLSISQEFIPIKILSKISKYIRDKVEKKMNYIHLYSNI